eukprot:scaffold182265_cov17-Prasinocladus_malaysianus.AAC.1
MDASNAPKPSGLALGPRSYAQCCGLCSGPVGYLQGSGRLFGTHGGQSDPNESRGGLFAGNI